MIRLIGRLGPATLALTAQQPSPFPPVPTTKVLAVGQITAAMAAMSAEARKAIMTTEVKDTVRLYLSGKIDQWYVRKDQNGVVFLMNASSVEEAHELLEAVPLGKGKLLEFDLIPVGPLSPLNVLLDQPAVTGRADSKLVASVSSALTFSQKFNLKKASHIESRDHLICVGGAQGDKIEPPPAGHAANGAQS
jgi:hypothetical protein